ncbi:hypothetical protein PIB30_084219 [Stylosanthes scabra]|uniref:Uncharacterized protein n=1 Tax=Stylosanthes scabra TaxID=79078 RepID=A0ABU6URC9_9FABA|nr:hypothetical protein [Stylosanthes scabra]
MRDWTDLKLMRQGECSTLNLRPRTWIMNLGSEAGPAPKSGLGFESKRIPNPGDFPSSVSNRILFFRKPTILSSNTSLHEPASRFGPALRLLGRSWAESAAFEPSQLNLGSTLVHLDEPVQWVNKPMVHLVNRSIGLDQSMPINSGLPPVNGGQRRKSLSVRFRGVSRAWEAALAMFFLTGAAGVRDWREGGVPCDEAATLGQRGASTSGRDTGLSWCL